EGGEWRVEKQRLHWDILDAFQDAAEEIGIPRRSDFNDGDNEGVGYFEVNQRGGVRWSTAKAFLRPAMARSNFRLETKAHTNHLILEGKKVIGINYDQHGVTKQAFAKAEVILCAGAVNSPKILELSGIGRGDLLQKMGITLNHELSGVGENLQDHLQIRTVFKIENAVTLNQKANSLFGKIGMGLQYALNRSGPLAMAPSQLGLFTKSDPALETPDLEFHIQPLSTDKLGDPLHDFPAITVSVCNLRPDSRGYIHIKSPNKEDHPAIMANYLSTESDKMVAARSIQVARKIMSAKRLKEYNPVEYLPGAHIHEEADLVREAGNIASTIFHPVGTCKMGQDNMAVVDAELKLHGLEGLRVVDASIMPTITSGNTNSPVIMIAEKAADFIQKDYK
ncbi:MAG: GMC family oxidoreductase, partial [Alphaproteobacteria bacterium]|nr:GMC family oxidoreductase [Alphaproteobacteria bacterium]